MRLRLCCFSISIELAAVIRRSGSTLAYKARAAVPDGPEPALTQSSQCWGAARQSCRLLRQQNLGLSEPDLPPETSLVLM